MNITVILCTYNRCQILAKALSSVARSRVPESVAWEVLVVDNNSHDQTRDMVADFCRRYPGPFAQGKVGRLRGPHPSGVELYASAMAARHGAPRLGAARYLRPRP